MARKARNTSGGRIYHVLNRSAGRIALFRKDADYTAFESVVLEARRRVPLRILAWCLMKNHWHFVAWPRTDDEVTAFFRWLTHTHAMRWRVARATVGWGHLYQGRFKAFPVQPGHHVLEVCRYVERNALTAGQVKRAQDWRWGSLWARCHRRTQEQALRLAGILENDAEERVGALQDWVKYVNEAASQRELERLRDSVGRGRPFGANAWVKDMVDQMGLEHTIRREGRPAKKGRRKDHA